MINFTLRQLRYFEALAKHRHFGRAAEACAISQPALSMQIKELEESLGAALFERGPRQVLLTGFGEMFLRRVRDILQSADDLGDLARAAQDGLIGRLRLGVIPTIAPYLLPRVLGAMKAAYPDMEVLVQETMTSRLIEKLEEGVIDAAIVAVPLSEPALTEVALFSEDFVLVRPASEGDCPVPDLDTLRNGKLLLLEEGHCFRDQALSFCEFPPGLPRDGLDATSLSTLVQLVGAGLGVTLIPEMAVAVETRSAPVAVSHFKDPVPSRTIGMIWRDSSPLADHLRKVAEIVRACGEENASKVG